MHALLIIKFGSDEIKTVKFPAPYGPVLTKKSKCHKIFNVWQIAKSFAAFYSCVTTLFIIKFGSSRIEIIRGIAF